MRPSLAASLGLARSLLTYYGMPWRRCGLRRLYRGFVGEGDLVFDIGAHVGNRSRTLHALGARVIAVEPQPLFAGVLRRTLPEARTTIVEKAVGRAPGRATLRISSLHPTVSTLSTDWMEAVRGTAGFSSVAWDGEAEVEVTTLDRLVETFGRPSFCKIDVEGLEAEILEGLSDAIPLVAFEFLRETPAVAEHCVARLEALGHYRFNFVPGERGDLALTDWADGGTVLALARRSGGSGDVYARLAG